TFFFGGSAQRVRKRQMSGDIGEQFRERGPEFLPIGHGERAVRKAMIGALKSDDAGLSGKESRGFERRLHRLGAGAGKNALGKIARRQLSQALQKLDFDGAGVDISHAMPHLAGLSDQGPSDNRGAMTEIANGERAG